MIRHIFSTFFTRFTAAICNLLIVIVLSNMLGAEGKGISSIIISIIAIFIIFNNFVGGPTLVYLIPRYNIIQLLVPSYIWTIICIVTIWIILPLLQIIQERYVIHVVALSFIWALSSIHQQVLLSLQKIIANNLINLLQVLFTLLYLLVVYYYSYDVNVFQYIYALYCGNIASYALSLLLVIKYSSYNVSWWSWNAIKDALFLGTTNQIAMLAQFMSYRLSYFFLDKYVDTKTVGIYSNGTALAESIWMISNSISMVLYAKIANSDNKTENEQLIKKFMPLCGFIAFIALIPLIITPDAVWIWIFGKEFDGVGLTILILSPGIWIFSMAIIVSTYFSGIGKYYINTVASFAGFILCTILGLLLIPQYKIIGAGISSSLSYILTFLVLFMIYIRQASDKKLQIVPNKDDFKTYKSIFIELWAKLK